MIITVKEYNNVIDGLRQQLELQRRMTSEKIYQITELKNQVETLEKIRKMLPIMQVKCTWCKLPVIHNGTKWIHINNDGVVLDSNHQVKLRK